MGKQNNNNLIYLLLLWPSVVSICLHLPVMTPLPLKCCKFSSSCQVWTHYLEYCFSCHFRWNHCVVMRLQRSHGDVDALGPGYHRPNCICWNTAQYLLHLQFKSIEQGCQSHGRFTQTMEPMEDRAIMVRCLAEGHKEQDRDSNPFSADLRAWAIDWKLKITQSLY